MSAGKYFSSRAQFHHKLSNNQRDWYPKKRWDRIFFFIDRSYLRVCNHPNPNFPMLLYGWHRSEHVICNFGKNVKLQFQFDIHWTILRAVATPAPTSKSIHLSILPFQNVWVTWQEEQIQSVARVWGSTGSSRPPCSLKWDKGLSIYYVIQDRGGGVFPIYYNITQGGSPQFITILHWGGYSFERKMEG